MNLVAILENSGGKKCELKFFFQTQKIKENPSFNTFASLVFCELRIADMLSGTPYSIVQIYTVVTNIHVFGWFVQSLSSVVNNN